MEGKTRCEVCERVIPKERLRVLPFTTTCVRCSRVSGYTEDDLQLDSSGSDDLVHMVQNAKEQS